jgi:predicted RNA binding protein YcfA (HicA-like mRNA interferase family)
MPMSGHEMLKLYKKAGWYVTRQKGSHVQVEIKLADGGKDNDTIPMHKELKKGTEADLLKHLRSVQ